MGRSQRLRLTPRQAVPTDGCWVSPKCIACGLPACKDDAPTYWPGGVLGKHQRLQREWEATGHHGNVPLDSHEGRLRTLTGAQEAGS